MMNWATIPVAPVPKPRQTRADKWKKRPAVLRYRAFADEIRLRKVQVPESCSHVIFIMPMPQSWPQKKKLAMRDQAHQQKPDSDNLLKALMDAVHEDDSVVWDIRVSKFWGDQGRIIIGTGAPQLTLDSILGDVRNGYEYRTGVC